MVYLYCSNRHVNLLQVTCGGPEGNPLHQWWFENGPSLMKLEHPVMDRKNDKWSSKRKLSTCFLLCFFSVYIDYSIHALSVQIEMKRVSLHLDGYIVGNLMECTVPAPILTCMFLAILKSQFSGWNADACM